MSTTISVATSADGYIDDTSSERLILSTPEDWAEVYALRAAADAIVIGGETLRRDNPRLTLKSEELRAARVAAGRTAEPHKVIISGRGAIDPSLRLFDPSLGHNIIIFSNVARPELEGLAEVVVAEELSAELVVTELEKRGLSEIFVEGGAQIIKMFLASGCVDRVRIAINPLVEVADPLAPRFGGADFLVGITPTRKNLGGMIVEEYTLREGCSQRDFELLQRAIELSRSCQPSATSYCVGAVVVTASGELFEGYTHETSPTHHAEQEAIKKAEAAGVTLSGATIYSSMEPCSTRSSEPESCSAIIIRHGFRRAVFALYEPSCFVVCKGALNMRLSGVEVVCIGALASEVFAVNGHLGDVSCLMFSV